MSEKFIDREYLIDSFKDYNTDIVEKKFDQVNESLADYGLNNVFDGVKQGYITVSTGNESDIDKNCVKSIDKKSCKPNDKITIKTVDLLSFFSIISLSPFALYF